MDLLLIGNECVLECNDSDMLSALKQRDLKTANKLLLLNGSDVDIQDEDGNTPLHLAARYGLTTFLLKLLSLTSNLDKKDKFGCTALCVALKEKHLDIAYNLIISGADLDIQDKDGYCALHYASFGGYTEIVDELANFNAKLDIKDKKKNTPLCIAIKKRHFEVAQQLMKYGADVNVKADYGYTALLFAMNDDLPWKRDLPPRRSIVNHGHVKSSLYYDYREGIYNIVDNLLQHGAHVNIQNFTGFTALHYASSLGCDNIVRRLLQEKRTDVDIVDDCDRTPLHIAVEHGHLNIVTQLIAAGADINFSASGHDRSFCCDPFISTGIATRYCWAQTDMSNKRTPLHIAVKAGHFNVARLLVHKGADVNRLDEDGATPLIVAAREGNRDLAIFLVTAQACINTRQKYGESALHVALGLHSDESFSLAKYLVTAGADANMRIGRKTLLQLCSEVLSMEQFVEMMDLSFACGYNLHRDKETSPENCSSLWLHEKRKQVLSLFDISRVSIRRTLSGCNGGRDISKTLKQLPLPVKLQESLRFR